MLDGQRTICRNQLASSTMWVPQSKLSLSSLTILYPQRHLTSPTPCSYLGQESLVISQEVPRLFGWEGLKKKFLFCVYAHATGAQVHREARRGPWSSSPKYSEGTEVQDHLWLHWEFEASLGYKRAEEMRGWLRLLAALPEDRIWFSADTSGGWFTTHLQSPDPGHPTPCWPLQVPVHTQKFKIIINEKKIKL